jgi:hypothetical protein
MFIHFVLTRFNVVHKSDIYKQDRNGISTKTNEWLIDRIRLFEDFCFPSMFAQTNKIFYWIVAFSDDTPDFYKETIKKYQSVFANFIPVFAGSDENHIDRIKERISQYLSEDINYLITSRIDNDDAFHKEMINNVQLQFNAQKDIFLSFNKGLQYDIEHQLLSEAYYECNAFISRIEEIKQGQFSTVLSVTHHLAHRTAVVKYINTDPLWFQLIHARNLYNKFNDKNRILFSNKPVVNFNILVKIKISLFRSLQFKWGKLLYKLKSNTGN